VQILIIPIHNQSLLCDFSIFFIQLLDEIKLEVEKISPS